MPSTRLSELRNRAAVALERLEEIETQSATEAERWRRTVSQTLALVADAIDRGSRSMSRLSPTSPSRRRLSRDVRALIRAQEAITSLLLRDVARLGSELAEVNARLERQVAEARSGAESLDRFSASAREVIGYVGKTLAIVGVVLAFVG